MRLEHWGWRGISGSPRQQPPPCSEVVPQVRSAKPGAEEAVLAIVIVIAVSSEGHD